MSLKCIVMSACKDDSILKRLSTTLSYTPYHTTQSIHTDKHTNLPDLLHAGNLAYDLQEPSVSLVSYDTI